MRIKDKQGHTAAEPLPQCITMRPGLGKRAESYKTGATRVNEDLLAIDLPIQWALCSTSARIYSLSRCATFLPDGSMDCEFSILSRA